MFLSSRDLLVIWLYRDNNNEGVPRLSGSGVSAQTYSTRKRLRLILASIPWRTLRELEGCRSTPFRFARWWTYILSSLYAFKARQPGHRVVPTQCPVCRRWEAFAVPSRAFHRTGQQGRNPRQEVVPTSCRGFLFVNAPRGLFQSVFTIPAL